MFISDGFILLRFGEGYTLSVRVKGPNYEREVFAMKRFIENHFPSACLKVSDLFKIYHF